MFLICSLAALFERAYFSSGKEVDCAHSEPISATCRRRMMENRLADGLVISLDLPKVSLLSRFIKSNKDIFYFFIKVHL